MSKDKFKTAKVKNSLKLVVDGGKKKSSSKKSAKSAAPSVVNKEEYHGRRIENGTEWEYEYKVPEYPPHGKALDVSRGPDGAYYVDLPDTEPLTGSILLYDPSKYVVEIPGSAGVQYTPPASAPNNVLRIEEEPVEEQDDEESESQQGSGTESEHTCSLCNDTQHEDERSHHGTSSQYSISEAGSDDSWISEISFKSKSSTKSRSAKSTATTVTRKSTCYRVLSTQSDGGPNLIVVETEKWH